MKRLSTESNHKTRPYTRQETVVIITAVRGRSRRPMAMVAALFLAQFVLPEPAGAVDYLFPGTTFGFWEDASLWQPAGVPGAGDNVRIEAGALTVTGQAKLAGGHLAEGVTVRFEGSTALGGGEPTQLSSGATVVFAGSTTWTGGDAAPGVDKIYLAGGTLINEGTFSDGHALQATITPYGGTNAFLNKGVYSKSGAGTTFVGLSFESARQVAFQNSGTLNIGAGSLVLLNEFVNTGTVSVTGGRLELGGGGSISGPFTVAAGGRVDFHGGVFSVGSLTLGGSGALDFRTTRILANGSVFASDATTYRFDLDGTGSTFTGAVTWKGGLISGGGTHVWVGSNTITGEGLHIHGGSTLRLAGSTNWTGNTSFGNNQLSFGEGKLVNQATFTDSNGFFTYMMNGGGSNAFVNEGVYSKTGASDTIVLIPFSNMGHLNIQAGAMQMYSAFDNQGAVRVDAGAKLQVYSPTFHNSGTLAGSGVIETSAGGALVNRGTLAPGGASSIGTLEIDGGLIAEQSSVLVIELADATTFDKLVVKGAAALGGKLVVIALPGFAPTSGDQFTVLSFGSLIGATAFDDVIWSGQPGFDVITQYQADKVMLTVVAVPEPAPVALCLSGLAMLGLVLRRRKQRAPLVTMASRPRR